MEVRRVLAQALLSSVEFLPSGPQNKEEVGLVIWPLPAPGAHDQKNGC